MARIRAVTFDLWDTIVRDDSDEPKRKAQGLRSKYDERRHLVWDAVQAIKPVSYETVALAYDTADAAFNIVWKEEHITLRLEQRLRAVLAGLDCELPAAAFDALVARTGRMEVDVPPDLIDGAAAALAALSQRYPLAICSDAIVTPGVNLRKLLETYDLKQYFSAFSFSDEVGHSKPHASMFTTAADALQVKPDEIVHIGDRDHNDIKGPQALGGKGILFTASRAVDREHTTADAICEDYASLPDLIDALARKA